MAYRERGRLILACFDPGETTGYARLALSKRLLINEGATSALRDAARGGRVHNAQFGLKGDWKVDEEGNASTMATLTRLAWVEEVVDPVVDTFVVVIEDFLLFRSEKSRSLLAPVRITARYEQEMRGSGLHLVKQTSSDAKRVVTDGRLRRWNLYDGGGEAMGGHSRDALRHGILFARKYGSHADLRAVFHPGRRTGPSQEGRGGE